MPKSGADEHYCSNTFKAKYSVNKDYVYAPASCGTIIPVSVNVDVTRL